MVNQDLFRSIHQQLMAHPEQHDQSNWEQTDGCHTTRCVAGWAVYLETGEQFHEGMAILRMRLSVSYALPFMEILATLLGIKEWTAERLFDAALREEEAVRAVKMFADGEKEESVNEYLVFGEDC
jgi:hypothetical protein